jgi:hypothetical protein
MFIADNRCRVLFITVVMASSVAIEHATTGLPRQAQTPTISVTGSRPLSQAIDTLERQYHWSVTYEDPVYSYVGDTSDVTREVRRDGKDKPRVLVPRGGPFSATYVAASESGMPDPLIVVRRVVAAYNASGFPGQFRTLRNGSMIHVVPTGAKDYYGLLQSSGSPFDAKINIPRRDRTVLATVEEFAQAVTAAAGIHVGFALFPANLLANTRVQIGADGEVARDVLARTLAATGQPLSWHLLYNPSDTEGAYFLSIHIVNWVER